MEHHPAPALVPAPATPTRHVMAIPHMGRGHINPMMNLCKTLASKRPDILITFVVTEEWLGFIGGEPRPHNIVLDTIPNVLPSERVKAKEMARMVEAVFTVMEAPVAAVLDRLIPSVDMIIVDTFLYWGSRIGNHRNIPVASFWPMAASLFSFFSHLHLLKQNGHFPELPEKEDELVDYIPGLSATRLGDLPKIRVEHLLEKNSMVFAGLRTAQYLLFSSVCEVEHQTIDVVRTEFSFPVYAVGPCIPYNAELLQPEDSRATEHDQYIQWLDGQESNSVLYVSLGSYLSVSSNQMDEIASGFRDSRVRILWVARDEVSRLKEVVGEEGMARMMIVSWCDQLRVLSHPAVGGFWSHCGWNSIKEGVFAGVPFLTFPISGDQPLNSKMVVENWKIGWRVRADATRQSIAELVRRFMDLEDDEGRALRRRAKELQSVYHVAVGKDGSAETSINEFTNAV